jgi:hypothetical protein
MTQRSLGRVTARTRGATRGAGKNRGASGRGVWGRRAWTRVACGLGMHDSADAVAADTGAARAHDVMARLALWLKLFQTRQL